MTLKEWGWRDTPPPAGFNDLDRRANIKRHFSRGEEGDTWREIRENENAACLAGMRNPYEAVQGRDPLKVVMGRILRARPYESRARI